ncbi:hypothetical protein QIH93_14985 [Bradyrhizobium ottawaense]|uniref:hypothetical protein n=1 Tax=Bradyrhizobium ottawaense TaxID=931866 RepID=UPI002714FB80|nr:hypothetical protein [Bradyrhizobium ottawaense]WLB49217.1 hypothetical protein QIH93_14985 [Bradyrhizobium ottawaense]
MSDDENFDESVEQVTFLMSIGLDPSGSVAVQLAEVRALIGKLRKHEAKLEDWARSGDFVLAVTGENVRAVINAEGAVMIVHANEPNHG